MATTTELERIIVRIMGDAQQYYDEIKKAMDNTDNFATRATKAAQSVGGAFAAMGAAVAVPLEQFGKKAVDSFAEFDLALTNSMAIMDDQGKGMTALNERLTATIYDLGTKGPQPLASLAKGYYFLASAGMSTEQAIAALPQIQKYATAGMFDLETATTLCSDALSALGMSSENAQTNLANMIKVQDALTYANIKTNANIYEFSKALTSKAGNAAAIYGQELSSVVGVLMAYAKQGVKASLAGHTFARSLQLLADKAVKNKEMFKAVGVEVFDASGNMRQFPDIIVDLAKAMESLTPEMRQMALGAMGFEVRIQQALLPLLNAPELAKKFSEDLKREAGGSTEDVYQKTMTSFSNQMQTVKNQLMASMIEVGKALAPILTMIAQGAVYALKVWNSFPKELQQGIVAGLALAAAITSVIAGVGAISMAIGFLGPTFASLLGPFTAAIVILGGLAAMVVTRMGGIGATMDYIKAKAAEAWAWIEPIKDKLMGFFSTVYEVGMSLFNQLADFIVGVWDDVVAAADVDWGYVQYTILNAIDVAEYAITNFQNVWEMVCVAAQLAFIVVADTLVHFFTSDLPNILMYSGRVMKDLFFMLPELNLMSFKIIVTKILPFLLVGFHNLTMSIGQLMRNLGDNTVTVFKSIPKLIKGTMSFEEFRDALKPIDDGIKDFFGELDIGDDMKKMWDKIDSKVLKGGPDLKARVAGPLEEGLRKDLEDMWGNLADDFGAFQAEREEEDFWNKFLGMDDATIAKHEEQVKRQNQNYAAAAQGVKDTAQKFDAALAGSAEAKTRMDNWLDSMGIAPKKGGGGGQPRSIKQKLEEQVKHFDPFAKGPGAAGGVGAGDTNDILKQILDQIKRAGGKIGGVDIDPADFGGGD